MGSLSNCVISNAIWAIDVSDCVPEQVAIIGNLICNLSGTTGSATAGTEGVGVIGIIIHGTVGTILVSNNVIRDLQGVPGGIGTNGLPGEAGESGTRGGGAIGIIISGYSMPIVANNLISNLISGAGGAGGKGGDGLTGSNAPDFYTPAGSGTTGGTAGNGTPYGSPGLPGTGTVGTPGISGTIGLAAGLIVTNGAPVVYNNIFQGSESSNTVAILATDLSWSGIGARCNYNNLWLWATNYIGLIPSHAFDTAVNPNFISMTDHHLADNSPCIDAIPWASEGFQAQDHDGVNRPLDGNNSSVADPDMGAYEYASALADTDGDTIKDAAELYVGTDPANNASFLCIASVQRQGSTNLLSWVSAPNRTYSVQCNTDLMTTNWTDVSTSESATVPTNIFAAAVSGTQTSLFYRIVVP
jgi:hypothetical protein